MVSSLEEESARPFLDQFTTEAWVSERGRIRFANAILGKRAKGVRQWDGPAGHAFWELFDPPVTTIVEKWFKDWKASGRGHCFLDLPDGLAISPMRSPGICMFDFGDLELGIIISRGADTGHDELRLLDSQLGIFRSYLKRGKIGLIVCTVVDNERFTLEYASEEAVEILEKPVSELVGTDALALLSAEDRENLSGLWMQVLNSEVDLPFVEMQAIAGDGEAINLEVMVGSMTWKGRPALFALFRDITERTLMLAELTRYAEAFELLQDTVVLADGSFRIIYVNPAGLERSGYSLDEVVDRPVDIFGAMRPGEEDTTVLRMALLEKGAWRGERWAVRKDGTEYPVDIIVTLQRDTKGNPQMVTLVSRDISLQKSNELSLTRARERAEFFRDLMSHDINNYIQGVIGRLELLAHTQVTDVQRSHISQAMEQAKRTSDLVSRVRTISQARHGEELHGVDLLTVIGESIEDLRRKYKDLPFGVSTAPQHERVLVLADDLLKDLVINVLDNAIKHNVQAPGTVEVATRPIWEGRKRFWRLEIADHGPGIPDSDKEEIFFKYVRKGGSPEGSGLGLSLVMAIAERYNGRVWIEDRIAGDHTQGARVVVELPAA